MNKVHVTLHSSSSLPTVTVATSTTNDRLMQRKTISIIFGIILGILIITAIVVPITIVFTKEIDAIETTMNITTKTTTTKAVNTMTKTITTQVSIKKTTTDFLQRSTTNSKENSNYTNNITTIDIVRNKYFQSSINRFRYWYQKSDDTSGSDWIKGPIIFRAYTEQVPGTQPIYLYESSFNSIWHNVLEIDPVSPVFKSDPWKYKGIICYCYNTTIPSMKLQPIHRYSIGPNMNENVPASYQFYLITTENEDQEHIGWTFDKILMYALPL